jgi:hypothetical protein
MLATLQQTSPGRLAEGFTWHRLPHDLVEIAAADPHVTEVPTAQRLKLPIDTVIAPTALKGGRYAGQYSGAGHDIVSSLTAPESPHCTAACSSEYSVHRTIAEPRCVRARSASGFDPEMSPSAHTSAPQYARQSSTGIGTVTAAPELKRAAVPGSTASSLVSSTFTVWML